MLAFLEKVQLKYHQKVGPLIERQVCLLDMECWGLSFGGQVEVRYRNYNGEVGCGCGSGTLVHLHHYTKIKSHKDVTK
jgi:hypothetical protein